MKVAMICDVMGQPNNGTTLAALNLIRYLRDAGHTVTVVAPGGEASDGYLPVRVWHAGPLIDRILRMNGVELAVPDKQLLEAVIREADVVHLLIPLPLARAALKIARRLGKPVTASFHCQAENITAHLGMMNAGWLNRLIYRNFYRKVYRWCTAVHYPTEFIREVFETATHPTPAHVISNGVNDMFRLPDSRPENGKFTVVCSGRYSREKAQQQLLRAAALCRHRDDIRLILAGDGPRRKHYLRLAKQYGLDCQFAFFPRQELLHILQTADLYVHTAIIEIEAPVPRRSAADLCPSSATLTGARRGSSRAATTRCLSRAMSGRWRICWTTGTSILPRGSSGRRSMRICGIPLTRPPVCSRWNRC